MNKVINGGGRQAGGKHNHPCCYHQVIAHQLSSVFFPVISENGPSTSSSTSSTQSGGSYISPLQNGFRYFEDIYDTLLCDPRYKMLSVKNVPQIPDASKSFSIDQWSALEKRVAQMHVSNSSEGNVDWSRRIDNGGVKSYANLLICRGMDAIK